MKQKTVFYCTDCGNETPRWAGRCPACGSWNTLVEQPAETKSTRRSTAAAAASANKSQNSPKSIDKLDTEKEIRFTTGLSELDRVLGGGAVVGSLVLIGGAPGIGKSTLLLQICEDLCRHSKVLYVTGEESERQVKMRAERLGVKNSNLFVLAETDISEVISGIDETEPDILFIDSIQTLYSSEMNSAPGSVGQVKECTNLLMKVAKGRGVTVFLVGHINKEGAIAGPKVLEHMVDCVLYFEGERSMNYRILRAVKNRFGSTNEIGMFEMRSNGLAEVDNPSEMLLMGRPEHTPGTCVTCIMEGTRPVLAEVQALVTPTSFNVPRRNSNGVDYNRAMMLLAVLEKRGGLRIGGCDAYLNVIGGLELNEPSADLAVMLALASSYRDKIVGDDTVVFGEIGLTGELRPVSGTELRLAEISRLGFKKCILPKRTKLTSVPNDIEVFYVGTINEALKLLL